MVGKSAWHFWLAAWNSGELRSIVEGGEAGVVLAGAEPAADPDEPDVVELDELPPGPRFGSVMPLSFKQL